MARAIDADEAILQIERREKYLVGDLFISVDAMKEFIKNRPTIEAEPVKHGKWEFNKIDKYGNRKPKCSVCGKYRLASWSDHAKCNYCPNCGARMDGE